MNSLCVNGFSGGIPEELEVSTGRDTGLKWLLIVVEFLLLYWQETSTRFLCEGLLSSWLHNCPVFLSGNRARKNYGSLNPHLWLDK